MSASSTWRALMQEEPDGGFRLYAPLATSLIVSIVVNLALWLSLR